MRAFTILTLPAAVMALVPVEHAGGPQIPPSVSKPLFTANVTSVITSTSSAGNLSITKTTSSTSSTTQGITLITTSAPGGGIFTSTAFVGQNPTAGSTSTSATGTTQPGAASKVGNSAIGALALAVGVGAIFL